MKNKSTTSTTTGAPLPFTFFTGIVPSCSFISKSIVFLGAGECGKSTFIRQLTSSKENADNATTNTSSKNLRIHSEHIQYSIFQNLVNIATNNKIKITKGGDDDLVIKQLAHHLETYVNSHFDRRYLDELLKNCKNYIKLLDNPTISNVIDNPELYPQIHLSGNHQYFFKHFDRIMQSSYDPTEQDVCNLQKKTVGIVNCGSMEFKNFKLSITDTGGQRNERKKWKFILNGNPDAIFFMVSLSECFYYCYEDLKQNRLKESLKCFTDILSSKAPIFLLFTKLDILEEIVNRHQVVFSSLFPEFTGSSEQVEQVKDFIIGKFIDLDSQKQVKGIHIVNTLDREEVEQVALEILNVL